MDALVTPRAAPLIPPAPKVYPRDLPDWRIAAGMTSNTLAIWSERAFDEPVMRRRVLGVDTLLINDPDAARALLSAPLGSHIRPIAAVRPVLPFTGRGLLLAESETWRRQRRMLAPVFTPANVGGLLPHFAAAAEAMIASASVLPRINLSALFHEATLDAVLRALFSLPADDRRARMARMVRAFVSGPGRAQLWDGLAKSENDFAFSLGPRRRFAAVWFAEVGAIVTERRVQGPGGGDMLDLLLAARDPETGEPLNDVEIREQSATMIAAGFETTSRLLFWTAYLLARDPAEQSRVRAEIAAAPPETMDSLSALQAWPRLKACLLEALRLYPPVSLILRSNLETETIMGETLPPGCLITISPWVMHRHRAQWDEPTTFRPDRFAGKAAPWTSGAFMPFGGGPRICIGASFAMAEAQVMLGRLLARFDIALDDRRPVLPVGGVTTSPNVEPWFKLTPRAQE
jgi:cytochrome P450